MLKECAYLSQTGRYLDHSYHTHISLNVTKSQQQMWQCCIYSSVFTTDHTHACSTSAEHNRHILVSARYRQGPLSPRSAIPKEKWQLRDQRFKPGVRNSTGS